MLLPLRNQKVLRGLRFLSRASIVSHSALMLGRIPSAKALQSHLASLLHVSPGCGIPQNKQCSSHGSSRCQCVLCCPFVQLCSYMSTLCLSEACWDWSWCLVLCLHTALGHTSCFTGRLAQGWPDGAPQDACSQEQCKAVAWLGDCSVL